MAYDDHPRTVLTYFILTYFSFRSGDIPSNSSDGLPRNVAL